MGSEEGGYRRSNRAERKDNWPEIANDVPDVRILKGVALERRLAMINHPAKGEHAAMKHGVVAPIFSHPNVRAAIPKRLISKGCSLSEFAPVMVNDFRPREHRFPDG